jgi:hypothetical protein
MTREQWDDTQKRCTGRPDAKPEALSTDELLGLRRTLPRGRLSLPEIKFGRIDGAILREVAWPQSLRRAFPN